MAMVQNHRFKLIMGGFDTFLVQEVTLPDVEYNVLQYGTFVNEPDVKVAGKKKVGEMTLKKLRLSTLADTTWRDRFELQRIGIAGTSWGNFELQELMPDGSGVAQRYFVKNAVISKISHSGFKRSEDSELVMEEITLAVGDFGNL